MTRRALAVSVLGVAAPICLLAAAWVADRMFHHHACRLSLGAQSAAVVEFEVVTGVEEDAFPDELKVSALLRDAIRLSAAERLQLRQDAAGCHGWRAATWLLHELDGAPLPRTAHNRAKRLACEGDWVPGDPYIE